MQAKIEMDAGDYHTLISYMINMYYHLDYDDKIAARLADDVRVAMQYCDDKYMPFTGRRLVNESN